MAGRVHCPGCQKGYPWKPELAGRKVQCKCGQLFRMPQADPDAAAPADDGIFGFDDAAPTTPPPTPAAGSMDFADPPPLPSQAAPRANPRKCPSCEAELAAEAVLCTACGLNLRTGKKISATAPMSHEQKAEANRAAYVRTQYIVPAALLVVGFLIQVVVITFFSKHPVTREAIDQSLVFVVFGRLIMMGVGSVFMLFGALLTSKLLGVGFGPIQIAAIKLAAVYVCATTASIAASTFIPFPFIGLAAMALVMFGMMIWQFDMDPQEAWLAILILWVLTIVIGMVLAMALTILTTALGAG